VVEHLGVSRRIASGGAADGFLIDIDDFIEMGEAVDPLVPAHLQGRVVQPVCQGGVEDAVNQGRFAGPGHAVTATIS
jgi:hypothetical protein